MKKTTMIAALALTMLAVYAIVNLVNVRSNLKDAVEQSELLQTEIEQARLEGERLQKDIDALDSGDGVEALARYRLRYASPDDRVFEYTD